MSLLDHSTRPKHGASLAPPPIYPPNLSPSPTIPDPTLVAPTSQGDRRAPPEDLILRSRGAGDSVAVEAEFSSGCLRPPYGSPRLPAEAQRQAPASTKPTRQPGAQYAMAASMHSLARRGVLGVLARVGGSVRLTAGVVKGM